VKRKNMTKRGTWVPLVLVPSPTVEDPVILAVAVKQWQCTPEEAKLRLDAYVASSQYWRNDLYQVQVRDLDGGLVHINVRRVDGAVVRDWRHLQRIKNEILGAECEAVEIFPAESRLVDTSNKYHLWGFRDPNKRVPVAIDIDGARDVVTEEVLSPPGIRQRAMEPGETPMKIELSKAEADVILVLLGLDGGSIGLSNREERAALGAMIKIANAKREAKKS
jgi:hypothetical protein